MNNGENDSIKNKIDFHSNTELPHYYIDGDKVTIEALDILLRTTEDYFKRAYENECNPELYVRLKYDTPYEAECRRLSHILDSELPSQDQIPDCSDVTVSYYSQVSENSDSDEIHEGSELMNSTFFLSDLNYVYKHDKLLFFTGLFTYSVMAFLLMYGWVLFVAWMTKKIEIVIMSLYDPLSENSEVPLHSSTQHPLDHSSNTIDL